MRCVFFLVLAIACGTPPPAKPSAAQATAPLDSHRRDANVDDAAAPITRPPTFEEVFTP